MTIYYKDYLKYKKQSATFRRHFINSSLTFCFYYIFVFERTITIQL